MKVLLTGNLGYIGSEMTKGLQFAGHDVVGLDTKYFHHPVSGTMMDMDIRKASRVWMREFDAVIHLAALSNDQMGDISEELTYDINRDASIDLAYLAKHAGVKRFIFASSCSVYGYGCGEPCDETMELHPLTAYAKSKADAEFEIGTLADDTFTPIYMRNATVYGVSNTLRNDLIVNTMTAHAYSNGEIKIYGDGTLNRPLIHVRDVVQAFVLALEAPKELVSNQAINVGFNSENYRVADVADAVRLHLPNTKVTYIEKADDVRSYQVNFDKIKQLLPEFTCTSTVSDGVAELIEYFQDLEAYVEHPLTLEYLTSEKYIRLKRLKELMKSGKLDQDLYWS